MPVGEEVPVVTEEPVVAPEAEHDDEPRRPDVDPEGPQRPLAWSRTDTHRLVDAVVPDRAAICPPSGVRRRFEPDADGGRSIGHVVQDDRVGADLCARADVHGADHLRAGPDPDV